MTKREAYLSFKCWHCEYLEDGSGECLYGETESDECPIPEYDGMTEVRNEIEKDRWVGMKRKKLTKAERQQVYEKYSGHCAYCGKEIEIKDMQVDHMIPLWIGGADEMSNYVPSCRQCNHYKRGNSLEGFREMIERIPEKLERDSYIYRVGVNYGNVIPHAMPIVFYFEMVGEQE